MGLSVEYAGRIPLVMGTLGKALGSFGAYLACSQAVKDYLVNRCAGFIYTTALPPGVLGAVDAALDLVPTMTADRARLHANADRLRDALRRAGIDSGASTTQIVPAVVGSADAALGAAAHFEAAGILGVAIRPPTVPRGTARVRLSLSAAHTDAHVDSLLAAVTGLKISAAA